MDHTTRWMAQIYIFEHDDGTTSAEARLRTADGNRISGHGLARKNRHDVDIREIGDELAVARALGDLSRRLLRTAAEDVEGIYARPVHADA